MGASPVVVIFHKGQAEDWADAIAGRHPDVEVIACADERALEGAIERAEVIFTWRDFPLDAFKDARRLRWVQVAAAGVDAFVQPGVLPEGVKLTRIVGSFGARMAEYVIAHTLAHAQRIPHALQLQRERDWSPFTPAWVAGRRMGVLGVGAIGGEIARLASNLGMRVSGLATSRRHIDGIERLFLPNELPELLSWSQVLVLALPLTERTRYTLNRDNLHLLQEDAVVINVGRGALVDEEALIERLRSGAIAGASLDVFASEPLPTSSPLWTLPNVIVTPHISGPTLQEEAFDTFSDNLARYVAGEPLLLEADLARGY